MASLARPTTGAAAAGEVPFGSSLVHSEAVDFSKPIDPSNIRGKTIVITGGASGFGAALSREWASHGANVIIGDVNKTKGEELVAELRERGSVNHHFVPLDVTDWSSQFHFFRQAASLSPHGGIDCVVANAGIADGPENAMFEDPPDYYYGQGDAPPAAPPSMRTYDVNLTGLLYTTNLALSYLSRNPGSEKCRPDVHAAPRDRHLILVSSIAGLMGLPGQPLYATAKHGVVGLFRTLRTTTPIMHGIRVNMINPCKLATTNAPFPFTVSGQIWLKSRVHLLLDKVNADLLSTDFVDTPILGPIGTLVLAGGGLATIDDVVGAATRLVADQGIIGRGLAVGAKTSAEHAKAAGLPPPAEDGQGVWDVYADDFQQSDLFTRRVIGVTNLITQARGYAGVVQDVGRKLSGALWRRLGY